MGILLQVSELPWSACTLLSSVGVSPLCQALPTPPSGVRLQYDEGDNYAYLGTRDRALECRCGSRICRGQALRVPLLLVTCYVCQTYKQPTRGATATWAPSYLPWSVSALMAIVGVASSTAGTAKWGAVTEQRDEGRDLPAVPECSHEYRHSPRGCSAETSQGSPP